MSNPEFSVIIPVYNSEGSLEPLLGRLKNVFTEMNTPYEVIFINDNSTDASYEVLKKLQAINETVVVIDLFRNYGQQNALMCGFNYCKGNFIVTMDDDLQQAPEDIPVLYKQIKLGYDVVIGEYTSKKHNAIKNLGSLYIRKLNKRIFNFRDDSIKFSSYRIIKKEVIDQIKGERTNFPYISGMLISTTKNIANVQVNHYERTYGKSSYSFGMMLNLAYNLVINYSSIPLKIVGYLGLIVSLLSMIFG